MTNVQAPNGYTINFDGQGGVAGFGKGSADVALTPQGDEQTLLKLQRPGATVGGKMAQIGSRLIDAAAGKDHRGLLQGLRGAAAGRQRACGGRRGGAG